MIKNHISKEIWKYNTGHGDEEYIRFKLKLGQKDLQTIDWNALKRSQNSLSGDHKATLDYCVKVFAPCLRTLCKLQINLVTYVLLLK